MPVNTKDLCLENKVQDKQGRIRTIKGIEDKMLKVTIPNCKESVSNKIYTTQDFYGIPLTELWMSAFGFDLVLKAGWNMYKVLSILDTVGEIIYWAKFDEDGNFYSMDIQVLDDKNTPILWFDSCHLSNECDDFKYVHHFQNWLAVNSPKETEETNN